MRGEVAGATLALAVTLTLTLASPALGQLSWSVPLDQGQAAVEAYVNDRGGGVSGGTFAANGWTTTDSGDIVSIPLPAGIDASRGTMSVTIENFELGSASGFFTNYHLMSLDGTGAPFTSTKAGKGGLQTQVVTWRETGDAVMRAKGFFNLADATCTDWMLCTGEAGAPSGWLVAPPQRYTITHSWDGPVDTVRFEGKTTLQKTIDLSDTAPTGLIAAAQLHWMINACGGSPHNACGQWDGPAHGGPIGVRYLSATLELEAAAGSGGTAGAGGLAGAGAGGEAGTAQGGVGGLGGGGSPGLGGSSAAGAGGLISSGPGGAPVAAGGSGVGAAGGITGAGGGALLAPSASSTKSDSGCSAGGKRRKQPTWILSLLITLGALRRRRGS